MSSGRKIYHWGVVMALVPFFSWSAEFSSVTKGERFQWLSLSNVSGGQAPSYWDIPAKLPAANAVIPGGVTDTGVQNLSVSLGSKTVRLPITIKGMVYRVPGAASTEANASGTATTTGSKPEWFVAGQGVGSLIIHLDKLESPITHHRPLIDTIDEVAWGRAFKDANAPKGKYTGTLTVVAVYDYIRAGVRVRHTLPFPLTVSVDYRPQFLADVVVTGNDVMEKTFHPGLQVSGKTEYKVLATGYFLNGVTMGLVAPVGADYFSLKSAITNKEIRYSVKCSAGCSENSTIIDKGAPVTNMTTKKTLIDATDVDRVEARIEVGFDPVSEKEYAGDTYAGSFTLVFEARI
ncbi:hypothetical protein [Vibrio metoecus]|uniref:hypothetical protein n=1 Tax=Vibrio metoecus TaxID=1481663 RepID=UPI0001B99A36|nr:hypothetical protein [Vibrio metoecus]EEX66638.1 hypothetical protein VCJ_001047 [Vibrio metoecus]